MILASNDFEQTLKLSRRGLEELRNPGADQAEPAPAADVQALTQAGLLGPDGAHTPDGRCIAEMLPSPQRRFTVRHLHAPEANTLEILFGELEALVVARIVTAEGEATDEVIFSRTIPENALHHAFSWLKLPEVEVPREDQLRLPAHALLRGEGFPATRGWSITSSELEGDVNIVRCNEALWRIAGISEEGAEGGELTLEAEDTLTFTLLVHHVWSACMR